jgi:hypothetical protein
MINPFDTSNFDSIRYNQNNKVKYKVELITMCQVWQSYLQVLSVLCGWQLFFVWRHIQPIFVSLTITALITM